MLGLFILAIFSQNEGEVKLIDIHQIKFNKLTDHKRFEEKLLDLISFAHYIILGVFLKRI